MFRRRLVVYTGDIFFAATANVMEAQSVNKVLGTLRVRRCRRDRGQEDTVDDAVTVHSNSPLSTDIFTVCHSPQQRYVSGPPAQLRTVKKTVGSGDIFRQEKIKGRLF